MRTQLFCLLALTCLLSCGQNTNSKTANADNSSDTAIIQNARDAYAFAFPLVVMDITRRKMTDSNNKEASAPNVFSNKSAFPDANFRDVVRPNADTYYSTASLDLSAEPVILSVPDTKGRYYMMPILDAYSNVFVSPGSRTTGTKAHKFLISGPGWNGTVPAGMEQIKAPTNMCWIIGRTQVNSKEDGDKVVVPLQKQYKLIPLSAFGSDYKAPRPTPDSDLPKEDPNTIVRNMPTDSFFNYFNSLMIKNPPAAADAKAMEKFALLGIAPGGRFTLDRFSMATQEALKKIPGDFFAAAKSFFEKPKQLQDGWNPLGHTIGTYGTDYQSRAFVAYGGLGANLREDAMYPSAAFDANGNPLTGASKYVIHFDKGKTPPAKAFWSLTMYDPDGYMVANPINRNAIGDRSNLQHNADGSTDIYIQHDSPGKDKENNWLPAPAGNFNILLRVYWPKEEMLNNSWQAPPLKKIG